MNERVLERRMSHAASKVRAIMARVVEQNGFLLRAIAVGACAIIVGILGWTLASLMISTQSNANRLTAIETTLTIISRDIERIADD